ncbi:MAG: hypothetical protein WA364_02975 [Candidatus Nitrosopolaris sp.]|jgi:hypothetical protein
MMQMCKHQYELIGWKPKYDDSNNLLRLPIMKCKEFQTHGADIFHFEGDKIKEVWTMFDALTPALELGIVEKVQPAQPEK